MPLDVTVLPGSDEAVFAEIAPDGGAARHPAAFHRLHAEGRSSRRVVDCSAEGSSLAMDDFGPLRMIRLAEPLMEAGCARFPSPSRLRVVELQCHGARQGGAGKRRPLSCRRAPA